MPRVTLSDRFVKTLKATRCRTDYYDATAPGLVLRVAESGRKSWCVVYRVCRLKRRMTLGTYPAVTLAAARKKAREARAQVQLDTTDPAAERIDARRGETVADLCTEYLERHAKRHKRSWKEDERIINAEVLPRWRQRLIKQLTRSDVRDLIEEIADRAPIMANRVLALVRKMLNFAVEREQLDANPAILLKKPGIERSRDRVLTEDEIRAVWGTFDEELSPTMAAAFKVRLLTGQRGGEVLGMQWTNIDLDAESWEIPGTLTKNGEVHRVPLVSATVAILREQRARVSNDVAWVFANEFGTGSVHHRAKKVAAQLSRALDFTFRGHDLRRTCATGMAEAGVPVDSIAKVLNHVDRGARATRVYDRYSYDREKRAALDAWARRLKCDPSVEAGRHNRCTVLARLSVTDSLTLLRAVSGQGITPARGRSPPPAPGTAAPG